MDTKNIFKAGVVQFDIINGQIETNMDVVLANLKHLASLHHKQKIRCLWIKKDC